MNSCASAPTDSFLRPTKTPIPWSTWTTRSPSLRSRKSDRNVRAADRRRSWRWRSSSKTSASATSCSPAALSLKPRDNRPCATTTAAPRIDSARSMLIATMSYSRSSSMVRSARPVVATTNTTVSRRSRARLMSATQSCTRPRYSSPGCASIALDELMAAWAIRGRSSSSAVAAGAVSSRTGTSSSSASAPAGTSTAAGSGSPVNSARSTPSSASLSPAADSPASPSSSSLTAGARRATISSHVTAIEAGSGATGLRATASP